MSMQLTPMDVCTAHRLCHALMKGEQRVSRLSLSQGVAILRTFEPQEFPMQPGRVCLFYSFSWLVVGPDRCNADKQT